MGWETPDPCSPAQACSGSPHWAVSRRVLVLQGICKAEDPGPGESDKMRFWFWSVVATLLLGAATVAAGEPQQGHRAPAPLMDAPVGYNYYYPPQAAGAWPARLYLTPRPVPPYVGYTYITYGAFAPHEYLYQHINVYVRNHASGGYTITWVVHQ